MGPGLPIILPKTEAQKEADRQLANQLANWTRNHYNPNWFQDTLDLLWNDPINYWMAKGGKQNIDNEYVRDIHYQGYLGIRVHTYDSFTMIHVIKRNEEK